MQKYFSCKYLATGSLLAPVTPIAWKKSTAGASLTAKCFKLHGNLTSGYIAAGRRSQRPVKIFQWIKSVITPASTAAMTAIPSVPKSHFLRLTLLGI